MRIRTLVATLALAGMSSHLPAAGPNLRITATHVASEQGSIIVRVYENADSWLGDGWHTQKVVKVAGNRRDGAVAVEIFLPPGDYAFSVFQDVNDDGKLERNFIGLPKEPAGLSNDLRPKFGPPRFKDAKFSISNTLVEQRIELH